MHRKSRYEIVIDFKKSQSSYIFDKSRNKKYLDFFGQYASLAVGYNHKIFQSKNFLSEMKYISKQKIVNNEIISNEAKVFNRDFQNFTSNKKFSFFHYSCTGSLAVESAIKTAIDYTGIKKPNIISFKGSFHGINGYGGIISDRIGGVGLRLNGFPGGYWDNFENPIINYKNNKELKNIELINKILDKVEKKIKKEKNTCCIIIEPIQCTNGDKYFPIEFFKRLREIATIYNVPLIFDEVQTGFCATGKKWYYEHINIVPDILIFGKKTQTSGIMVNKKYGKIFKQPIRLEVTWDGDIVDMIRCKYIISAFKKDKVLSNVNKMSELLKKGLIEIKNIKNIRNSGLIFAFDLKNKINSKSFATKLFKNQMLCNPTGNKTIRLRPHLFVNKEEIFDALNKIELSIR